MVTVAGIRFKAAGKVYYFDPGDLVLSQGDNVIVETARGIEYGTLAYAIKEVEEKDIVIEKVVEENTAVVMPNKQYDEIKTPFSGNETATVVVDQETEKPKGR